MEAGTISKSKADCPHEVFGAHVDVNRLEDTGRFVAEVRIHCTACGLPFSFVGPPLGMLMSGPAVSVDRTELRIPIEPGPTKPFASGEMRVEAPQARRRES